MGAWGQYKENVNKFWGVYWQVCHQNDAAWFFDDLQQYYERLPIHPPKHGLPANYAIDSWLWLSRVSVLGAPVRCLLLALVWVKHAVCSMVSRQQHTRIRQSARTTYHSYRKGNIFFLFQYEPKTVVIYWTEMMRVRLNLPTALVLHFELSAVVLVATSCCSMC